MILSVIFSRLPPEKIRRLDETMQEHLQEKTVLVAEVLNIPTAEVPQRLQVVFQFKP
jgi:hypothetical protein